MNFKQKFIENAIKKHGGKYDYSKNEFGMEAVSSAGHILLCAGCHTDLHKECA